MAPPSPTPRTIRVIDSHTAGEPTRIVVDGGPGLGSGNLESLRERFLRDHDRFRSAVVNEPRGSDVLVGALLLPPYSPDATAGVIFFNNVGCLGMCGHGTIGLIATLRHLGRIESGLHWIDTPVGKVSAELLSDGRVRVGNVPSRRTAAGVRVRLAGATGPGGGRTPGEVVGDVAWAGNWFFLVADHGQELALGNVEQLTEFAWRIRRAVNEQGHPEVDHVELFSPLDGGLRGARNFVLCPGKAYDRSPCGTGTSAKLACLAADRKLDEGETWVQESILGTRFEASYHWIDRQEGSIAPMITGTAHVNADATLLLDERDPFCWGIRS